MDFAKNRVMPNESPHFVPAPVEAPAWQDDALQPLLVRLDLHLRDHPFLVLDALTIADFSVGGMMTYFRAADLPFTAFPRLAACFGRLGSLEAWQTTEVALWRAA